MTADTIPGVERRRRIGAWTAIVAGIVVVGFATAVIASIAQMPARGLLDPDAAGPDGAGALVRLLEREGIDVEAVRTREQARAALEAGDRVTLAWADTSPLSDQTVAEFADLAADVVMLDPRSRDLRVLFDSTTAGSGDAVTPPECDLDDAVRAGSVWPGTLFAAADSPDAVACYPSGDDAFGLLVRDDEEGHRVAAVDATVLMTNRYLADDGNAALALNLLGRHDRVVWYLPGDSDFADSTPALGDLTPPWVTPVMVLLLGAAVAAAVWRGRRFGPLVAERLPVTVRAAETTEGRARLYARAGDPTHAADQLRIATLRRLARTMGLGPAAAASDISDAVATRLGADRTALRGLLIDDLVADDRALVDIADRLRTIEHQLRRSLRPERNTHE